MVAQDDHDGVGGGRRIDKVGREKIVGCKEWLGN
jgi:hypothetical protein